MKFFISDLDEVLKCTYYVLTHNVLFVVHSCFLDSLKLSLFLEFCLFFCSHFVNLCLSLLLLFIEDLLLSFDFFLTLGLSLHLFANLLLFFIESLKVLPFLSPLPRSFLHFCHLLRPLRNLLMPFSDLGRNFLSDFLSLSLGFNRLSWRCIHIYVEVQKRGV